MMSKLMAPDTFYGSFPVSTPVQSWGNQGIEGNPLVYAGQNAIANAWYDENYKAATKIRDALEVMAECVQGMSTTIVEEK
jgi:hypothetical protein